MVLSALSFETRRLCLPLLANENMIDPPLKTGDLDINSHFAWLRTHMSLETTLLSAIRTATTLIGFGFTVAQFFQKLQGNVPEGFRTMNPALPRNVGLLLIAVGVISLAIFTHIYHRVSAYLRSAPFEAIAVPPSHAFHKPSDKIAYIVLAVGVLAFLSVLVRF